MSLPVTLLGTTYEVTAPAPVLAVLSRLFPPALPTGARRHVRLEGTRVLVDGASVDLGHGTCHEVQALLVALNAQALADVDALAVHAGVVAHAGRAAAFPGVSGAGKSTLTAACLRAGAQYVSDEALVVGWHDDVLRPYGKPLTLSTWSLAALGLEPPDDGLDERAVAPAELGATWPTGPVALAHVVLPERRPGPPELVPLSRAGAAAALLQHSFNHYRRPREAFGLVSRLAALAQGWVLRYDEPGPAAAVVLDLLAAAAIPPRR